MSKTPTYHYNELTKTQQECLTLIESLGIYELRALARVFGGNSPTTLKRNDHITIVMDKIISGEDLKPIPLRQGRPYKELSNIEGILAELSQITGKDYTLKGNQSRNASHFPKMVTFRQVEENMVKQKLFPIEVHGIICPKNDKEFFVNNLENNKNVLVKKDLNKNLKPFDYIEGSAVIMNEDKEYILDSIKSINFQKADTYEDIYNPYINCPPNKTLNGYDILLGTRYLLKQSKFIDNQDKIKNLVSQLKQNNIVTLAIVPNVLYENFLDYNSLGFSNIFMLKYEDSPFVIYETLRLFINHVQRLQEQGINVAIFVEDIVTIAGAVDYSFKNNTKALMGHTETAVESIKQLMMLAKAGENNKHTTLFTTLDEADMLDPLYISSVYKISKKLN